MDIKKRGKWSDGILEYWAQKDKFCSFTSLHHSSIPLFLVLSSANIAEVGGPNCERPIIPCRN
jgi:hypothetical protein